jgi:curved DNA-binding protein CbpA
MSKYHKILGLPNDASEKDIKKAYRKLAMQFHPDTSKEDTDKFHKIKDAYEFLLLNKDYNFDSNEPITREDNKIFLRKYNKWVTQEEYENLQKSVEDYRKQKQSFEDNRANIEFEELKKSKVYRAFNYVAGIGLLFIILLLIDNYKKPIISDATINSVTTNYKGYHPVTTIQYQIKNNYEHSFSYYGRKRNFITEGTKIKLHKTPIFRFDSQFITNYYIFFNKKNYNDFHIPLIFFFLVTIILAFVLKGATPLYYFALNTVVFGIPSLIGLFLIYALFN